MTSYFEIDGLKIVYNESGNLLGPAIVFVHGANLSSEMWRDQISEGSLQQFRLITFDLPGHGKSDRSQESRKHYSLKGLSEILIKVLEKLGLSEFVLIGLSLGTNLIAEGIARIKNCKGIVLAAPCLLSDEFPVEKLLIPSPYGHVFATAFPSESDISGFVKLMMTNLPEEYFDSSIQDFKATDPNYRLTIGESIASKEWSDEIVNIAASNIPVCVIQGQKETLVKPGYLESAVWKLWQSKIHYFEEAGHLINWHDPKRFNELIMCYSKEMLTL